jgi:hypothetical protein
MEENQKHSGTREQRRSPRIETSNLVGYIIFDNKGNAMDHGKGQTLNLSQNGILLETLKPLKGVFVMLMTIDLDGKVLEVKGRLIYSSVQKTTGHYFSGIVFIGPKDQQVAAIVSFVKSYYRSKPKGRNPRIVE